MSVDSPPDEHIKTRDGDRCARCGKTSPLHVHHRLPRSGGTDERACNRVTLCGWCHSWAHHNPGMATRDGWVVSRYDDPAMVPVQHVLWPGVLILLTDEHAGVKIFIEND